VGLDDLCDERQAQARATCDSIAWGIQPDEAAEDHLAIGRWYSRPVVRDNHPDTPADNRAFESNAVICIAANFFDANLVGVDHPTLDEPLDHADHPTVTREDQRLYALEHPFGAVVMSTLNLMANAHPRVQRRECRSGPLLLISPDRS
jgi:hypothetical protein